MDQASLTARSLQLDLMALEVTSALGDAGTPSLLLKGASFAEWLFTDGTPRPYSDCDILVAPDRIEAAGAVLEDLGFKQFADYGPGDGVHDCHDQAWLRDDGLLELHFKVPGIQIPAKAAWQILVSDSMAIEISGRQVPVLGLDARALHLVLHADHHGVDTPTTLRDLTKALQALSDDEWADVAALARRMDAEEGMSLGLRLLPDGVLVADRLGLPSGVTSIDRALRQSKSTPGARGLALALDPYRDESRKARILSHLLPTSETMRVNSTLARRPRGGLQLAYAVRLATRFWQLPRAIIAVWQARRAVGGAR